MLFRRSNIRIEFTEGEKETLKKALPILDAIAEKMGEDSWFSLGVDGETCFEQEDVNCAVGILTILNNEEVEIIIS